MQFMKRANCYFRCEIFEGLHKPLSHIMLHGYYERDKAYMRSLYMENPAQGFISSEQLFGKLSVFRLV